MLVPLVANGVLERYDAAGGGVAVGIT